MSKIGLDEFLTVRFPDLKENQVVIPRTTKLIFNISLSGTDTKKLLVINLVGISLENFVVELEGNEIINIEDYDILFSYYDCWKSTTEKSNADNKLCILLDFEILKSGLPLYQ